MNKQMIDMLNAVVAAKAPQLVRPEMRTQYGLPHGVDPAEVLEADRKFEEDLDAQQEYWLRKKKEEDLHAIPVVAVVPGKVGGYLAMWGNQSRGILPDRYGKSEGYDTFSGLVVTKGNALPGGLIEKSDKFYTFEDAVYDIADSVGLQHRKDLIEGALDAVTGVLCLGDDAEDVLQELYYDFVDCVISESPEDRPDVELP